MNYLLVMPKGLGKSPGGYNIFPVGIAYISAYLKMKNVRVTTCNLEYRSENTDRLLKSLIAENGIDVICTSGLSRDFPKVKEVVDKARKIKPNIISVVGGGIISGDPEPAMIALDADIGVIGEGEITMCELAHRLDHDLPFQDLPGIIFKKSNNEFNSPVRRAEITNLDSIPIPDYAGFDYGNYLESQQNDIAFIIASRSCPFSCTFCFHPSGRIYRQRSLDNLFAEIDFLRREYDLRCFSILDELFATKRQRILEFCERIKKYNVTWALQQRVNDVDSDILRRMRDSGCITISYGIESADNGVLKSMKKQITVEQTEHALDITQEANLDIQGGLIFGDIAETPETARRSLEWNDTHPQYALELNMIHIFPGTPLYAYAVSKGIIKDRVEYLKAGVPLVNLSQLTDQEYKDLSSLLYERNMRAKYAPKEFNLTDFHSGQMCKVSMKCNRCQKEQTFNLDVLHISRILCSFCNQRHYVDPFHKLTHSVDMLLKTLPNNGSIALWGSGEMCIKLLDTYSFFKSDKYLVVDISKSRQGYTVCGKFIYPPHAILERNIQSVILTVIHRKDEILAEIGNKYSHVSKLYIPDIVKAKGQHCLTVREL
jgi:radical SAM superfamily enzyme YgiQ (UPF0313 family)